MRFFYNLLAYVLLVIFAIYGAARALFNRSYRANLGQRFGFGHPRLENSIWVHAVSVGEVVAAEPLIRALLAENPGRPLLVTTVTPTGAARARATFGDRVAYSYIPFEAPYAVNRFFRRCDPSIALILETEIWPNLYHGCGVRNIPLVLVSARISPRSVKSYRRLLPLFRETLSHGIVIAAQSRADAQRFISLGASEQRTRVTGNIKFDIQVQAGLDTRGAAFRNDVLGADRPVWVAASTHEGEEQAVLDAHAGLLEKHPGALLVLVPRHPERFAAVEELVRRKGFSVCLRTDDEPCPPSTEVFLGNTMGELMLFYAASDLAFVGGSLIPIGGHNLLEPAALGLPILTGPHTFNAEDITRRFVAVQACRVVENSAGLCREIGELLDQPDTARALGSAASKLVADNRGALDELLSVIRPLIAP